MSFLHEKETKRYVIFLGIFCMILFLFSFGTVWTMGEIGKESQILWEKRMAFALLEEGIQEKDIAAALHNERVTEEGSGFVEKIGHLEETGFWLFSLAREEMYDMFFYSFGAALLLSGVLTAGTLSFLKKREILYQKGTEVLKEYQEGDFSHRLSRQESGTIYQLFGGIDKLATALQSKNEAERHSREFLKNTISDISHQLKTPLAALNMYTEIILEEPDDPETVTVFAKKSMQSLERMERLIQALLKITRLDAGSVQFVKKPCRILELVEAACEDLKTRAKKEEKNLIFSGDEKGTLLCDRDWTVEAIGNLIKNALDHTAKGGHIQVSWQSSAAMIRLTVTDDGTGIASEDIHHIFKRFYRSKNSRDIQGVGLGLPLAKSIIEGQGGILSVQSVPGQGTVFTLSFLTET